MSKKIDRASSTRARIIASARRLFAANGYEGTSTETVLEESGVSRGALYHHFENKEALFAAVLEAVEVDITDATTRARANVTDPLEALRVAFAAFLELAREPEVRQIVLIDAHSVVGWQKWREIEERHASLIEVAFLVARSPDPAATANKSRAAIDELLERVLR
jgi:AcrR family transcriptional regulator